MTVPSGPPAAGVTGGVPAPAESGVPALEPWLRDILRCPVTGATLVDGVGPDGSPELVCTGCGLAYPVRDDIPVLLVDEARRPA